MDALRILFRHHAWATDTLLDHCAALPASALSKSVPGAYGSVVATLVHLVRAEQIYLELLTGAAPDDPLREGAEPPLRELQSRFATLTGRWGPLLDSLPGLDVTIAARGPWEAIPHATNLLLLQAIQHGNDHRTHVCTVLGAHALPVPELDGWSFWPRTRA